MPVHTRQVHERKRRAAAKPVFAKWKVITLAVVVLAVVGVLLAADIEWQRVPQLLEEVNRPVALLVMATLPIVGFPISAVYLAAGALFGPLLGGVVVTAITLIHVLVTQLVARTVLRKRVERWQKTWSEKLPVIPVGESATLVAMVVIVPGLPYLARNCILALSGAPLRYVLGVGVPLYVLRSYVTIFLGNLGNDPSRGALIVLAAVFAVKLAASALLFQRLRRRSRPAAPH